MKKFLYGNVLQTSTLQFDGHIREYFVDNSRRTVVFYILPRSGNIKNFIEIYEKGRFFKKIDLFSPKNIVLAYIFYYFQYLYMLFFLFPFREKINFINHLPIFFFFNSLIRIFKRLEITYWIADYWPMGSFSIKIFRFLTFFYHSRSKNLLYITDRVNRRMNGRVISEFNRKTVMLGVKPSKIKILKTIKNKITLCFIGVIVESQGIELLLEAVYRNKNVVLRLIGTGDESLIKKYKDIIKKYKIGDRVYFPKKFFYGKKLYEQIQDAHVGVALYKIDKNTATFFADPAKVKQYAEFNLPILMTNSAEIAEYLERFNAGKLVERNVTSVNNAIEEMKRNYNSYLLGLSKFNNHFEFNKYFRNAFEFLETNDDILPVDD